MAKFDSIRQRLMRDAKTLFEGLDFEVLITGTQELCIPIVDEEGEEGYVVLTFKIPKGDRDGNPYDGYAVAEDFAMKQKAKAEKAKTQAEAKAKKIALDKARREAKAKAKKEEEQPLLFF